MAGLNGVGARAWALALAPGARPVVLVDGGSGSGKTTLARQLVATAPVPATLVSLDSFYPGWDGLAAASRMVVDDVLGPPSGYRCWDWARDEPAAWVPLDPHAALVVVGCGALTPASRALATCALWLDLDAETRRARALGRDGDAFAPHWDRWAAQEEAHWEAHRPWQLADLVLRVVPSTDSGPHGEAC